MFHIELTNLTFMKTALRKSYFILFSNYTQVLTVSVTYNWGWPTHVFLSCQSWYYRGVVTVTYTQQIVHFTFRVRFISISCLTELLKFCLHESHSLQMCWLKSGLKLMSSMKVVQTGSFHTDHGHIVQSIALRHFLPI